MGFSIAILGPGSSPHVHRLAAVLAARGHRLHVISEDQFAPFPKVAGVRFYPYRSSGNFVVRARAAAKIIKQISPDILHSHAINHGGYIGVASGFHPHVLTAWGSDVFLHPHRSRFDRLATFTALRAADWVLSSSPVMQAELAKLGHRTRRNDIMLWGVDTTHFEYEAAAAGQFRSRLGVAADAQLVFCPRILAPYYNQHALLEAWPEVSDQFPNAILVLSRMRAVADYERQVRERAVHLGIGNRLRWLDTVPYEDLPAAYSSADVIVSIPTTDSMPITLLESMACERLSVATDHPSLRDWLADFEGASLVDPHAPHAIARAITTMLGLNSNRQLELGRAARQIVVQRADREQWMERLETIYATLHGERSHGHVTSLRNFVRA